LFDSLIEGCTIDFGSCKYILGKLKEVQRQDEEVMGQRYISAPKAAAWIFQFST
jgi:hypothetical protein